MIDRTKILEMMSTYPEGRDLVKNCFSESSDKAQFWQELIRLAHDDYCYNRSDAVSSLESVFVYVDDKNEGWNDLLFLIKDNQWPFNSDPDGYAMWSPSEILGRIFSQITEKNKAWDDLLSLISEGELIENYDVSSISRTLSVTLDYLPEKSCALLRAMDVLRDKKCILSQLQIKVLLDDIFFSRFEIISSVEDKNLFWRNVLYLIKYLPSDDSCYDHRSLGKTSEILASVFELIPERMQAWRDLISLFTEETGNERIIPTASVIAIFSKFHEKLPAWIELVKMMNDQESPLPIPLFNNLFYIFKDKWLIWADLNQMGHHQSSKVRSWTAKAIGSIFKDAPSKYLAWNLLFKLSQDEDLSVSKQATSEMILIFDLIDDKDGSWNDIISAIYKNNIFIQRNLLSICESIIPKIGNKLHAREDLLRLSFQGDSSIRLAAMQTFGASFRQIYKEEDLNENIKMINEIVLDVYGTNSQNNSQEFEKIRCLLREIIRGNLEIGENVKNILTKDIACINDNLREVHQTIIRHESNSEIRANEILENQNAAIQAINDAVKKMTAPDPDLSDLIEKLDIAIMDIKRLKTLDLKTRKIVERISKSLEDTASIEDPMLKLNLRLEGTLPIIPQLMDLLGMPSLRVVGELKFSSGFNLKVAWAKVMKRFGY